MTPFQDSNPWLQSIFLFYAIYDVVIFYFVVLL